ncbi:MAG TPA: D-xylose ABC transporter ATP-binding protein [Firmicutes bacterium]|jgi:ABC-type sugar transport system ATPase subunit|nr:D-xylose ABC transporter ATP-binding protein [Bacillota bacterium]
MQENILSMRNIHKKFPGVYALNGVNFELCHGEVHALLGENGAGKSTLIKILAGIYTADEGEILIEGKKAKITDVYSSQAHGISVIHQELCLAPAMTVTDNIFLGKELAGKGGFINFAKQRYLAQKLLDSLKLEIKATDKVSNLSVAQQQMVEIAKALSIDAEIIVMDEPTASLTSKEVEMLFQTIKELKKKNIAIIYISHRLEELFQVSDRVTVLRDGKYIGTRETVGTTRDELIAMMVGRELKDLYKRSVHPLGETVLEVKNLNRNNILHNISFSLKKGEILGISGLVGSGRTELARAIFGIDSYDSGEILISGQKVQIHSAAAAMENGIALVPEDRKGQGLVLIQSVSYNITIPILKQFMKFIHINRKVEEEITSSYIEKLSIRTPSLQQIAQNLSGGNQQKIVIAKWLGTHPKILIMDEPTRGVDVGAKAELYSIINMLAEQGVGIIMISSELPEIVNMSDRVLVMFKGRITGRLERKELQQETVMYYATGGIKDAS